MYYLDYAKKVGDRYILNFFADTAEDIADVPTNTPYITRNGTNYGVPLETSIVTVIENDVRKNYVLQNGAYVVGGDIPSVLGTLEATENKTYNASDENLEGYSTVTVNVLSTPTETKTVEPNFLNGNEVLTPTEGSVFSSVTLTKPDTLLPENIKKGVIICGIEGTYEAAGA